MIWVIIALSTVLIAFIVAFLICGVRAMVYFDLESATFVCDIFILRRLHAVKYKIFECNGRLYSQFNARDLKEVGAKDKSSKRVDVDEEDNKEKLAKEGFLSSFADKINAFSDLAENLPTVKLKLLRTYLTVGTGDSMSTSVAVSALSALMGVAVVSLGGKIKAKTANIGVYPNFRWQNTVLSVNVDTGAGLYSVLIALLKILKTVKETKGQSAKRAKSKI